MSLRRTGRNSRVSRTDRRSQRTSQTEQDSQAEQQQRNRMHADFFRNIVGSIPELSEQQRRLRPSAVLGSAASEADFTQASDAIENLWDRIVRSSREETNSLANISGMRASGRSALAPQQQQQRTAAGSLYSRSRLTLRSGSRANNVGSQDNSTAQADGWTFVNMRPRTSTGDGIGPSPPRARRRLSNSASRLSVRIRRPSSAADQQNDDNNDNVDDRNNIGYINFGDDDDDGDDNEDADANEDDDDDDDDDAFSGSRYSGYNAFDSSLDQGQFIFFNSDDVDEEVIGYTSEELTDDVMDDELQAEIEPQAPGQRSRQTQTQGMWTLAATDDRAEAGASDFSSWLENTLRFNPSRHRQYFPGTQSSSTSNPATTIPVALTGNQTGAGRIVNARRPTPRASIAVRQHWNEDRVWEPYIYKQLVPNSVDLLRDTQNEAKQDFVRGLGHEYSRLYCVHSQVRPLYTECSNADDMGRGTLNNIFSSGRSLFITSRPENVNLELTFSPDHALTKHCVVERILIQSSRALHTPCTEIMVFASSRRCNFAELKQYDNYTFAQYEKLSANLGAKNKSGMEIPDPRPIAYFWLEHEESYKQLQLLPQGVTCKYLYFKMLRGPKNSKVMSLRTVRVYGWDGPRAFSESALC
ncbi:hypothetical protein H4R99_001462 [Coemansia sp. RSA 1722]|nr:hypothetical protein IWW45_002801 [Coemansia sp. RSA 485]KAJ2604989.1 hypothetical protein H4R99_001462 [Coemansia sp. RSA 1722]